MADAKHAKVVNPEQSGPSDWLRTITNDLIGIDDVQRAPCLKELVETVQSILCAMSDGDDAALVRLRAGMVVTLSVLQRMSTGKTPRDFAVEDWAAIAHEIEAYAVSVDGQSYTAFVFCAYAAYIETSAEKLEEYVPAQRRDSIRALADELRERTCALEDGEVGEAAYTEECLWVCLEAMVKLLSATAFLRFGNAGEFLVNLADYGVAYGQLTLYRKEQTVLQDILNSQEVLDRELQARYEDYLADLDAQSAQFQLLVRDAFCTDVRGTLKASAELARTTGVPEEEILKTIDDVDRFFLE